MFTLVYMNIITLYKVAMCNIEQRSTRLALNSWISREYLEGALKATAGNFNGQLVFKVYKKNP